MLEGLTTKFEDNLSLKTMLEDIERTRRDFSKEADQLLAKVLALVTDESVTA